MKPGETYQPTRKDFELAKDFAINAAKYHRRGKRTKDEIISDIIIGKIGEIAYKSWMGSEVNDLNYSFGNPDDGWDFTKSNGDRVQVKTLRPETNWVTFNNWYWEELVVIRYYVNYFQLEHIKSKSEINAIAKPSKYRGFYYEA